MRPPICVICDRDQRDFPDLHFEYIAFREAEYPEGPGHSPDVEWFCEDHLPEAKKRDYLLRDEAIRQLREREKAGALKRFFRKLLGM